MIIRHLSRLLAAAGLSLAALAPAAAAQCGGDFNTFLAAMAREAQAAGVSRAVIDQAFAGLTPDPAVLAFDRRQRGTFRKTLRGIRAHPRHPRAASSAPRR